MGLFMSVTLITFFLLTRSFEVHDPHVLRLLQFVDGDDCRANNSQKH
jgi:hypothetical protein